MAGNRRITRGLLLLIGGAILFFGACSNKLVTALFEKVSLAETDPPVPGDGGEINPDDVRAAAVTLSWEKATDEFVDQTALAYKVVYSTSDNIDTAAKAEKNGTVGIDWTADIASGDVAGLTIVTEYYFNVLVRDIAGNIGCYGGAEAKTIDDTKQPIPAGDIEISEVGTDGFTVSWEKAKDDEEVTPQDKLEYLVVYSTDDSEIQDAVEAEQYGTHAGTWEQDIDTKTITTMEDYVTYYVNVLVRDEVKNTAAYKESDLPSQQTVKVPRIYWAEEGNSRIRRARLDGSEIETVVNTNFNGESNSRPQSITMDTEKRIIYWTDSNFDRICCSNLDGSGKRKIISSGLDNPFGITIDPDADVLYWTDYSAHYIYSASVNEEEADGLSFQREDTEADWFPYGIAISPEEDEIYWVETHTSFENSRIRQADIDGLTVSNVSTFKDTDLEAPRGITYVWDDTSKWIYWTDTQSDEIWRITKDKLNDDRIVISTQSPQGVAVNMSELELYFSDKTTDIIYKLSTELTNEDPSDDEFITLVGTDNPVGLFLDLNN